MTLPDFKGAFMPSMLPAAPGTYILELLEDSSVVRTPIIAWAPDAENPYRAPHPITVDGLERLLSTRAILHSCGMVQDRNVSPCFASVDEWVSYRGKAPKTSKSDGDLGPKSRAAVVAAAESEGLIGHGDGPVVEFTTKSFKNNSFYQYDDDDWGFIFTVPGGVNVPKVSGPVTKIKRDQFMELKKTLDVADITELMEGTYGAGTGSDQEQPEVEDEDEDDDDLSDLL